MNQNQNQGAFSVNDAFSDYKMHNSLKVCYYQKEILTV